MSDALIVAFIGLMAAPIAAFITWVANRKKNVADIYGVLTASSQSAVETMQATMETLHEELQSALDKIDDLQAELELMRKQNAKLLQENADMHTKMDQLIRRLAEIDPSAS